ncbi:hypothetical protein niasHT_018119 [Heterodera trifolii]|uniref:THUMP domain-containing protein n=1 Tax=Heterodera trifolii TaxID=157864 RepID=A0ABD2L3H4_9BILA
MTSITIKFGPLRRLPISKLSELICLHFVANVFHGQLREWASKKDRDPTALIRFVSEPEKKIRGIEVTLEKWLNNCSKAFPELKASKFRPIIFEIIPPGPLEKLGTEIAKAFENIRAVKIHGLHRTIRTSHIIAGDRTAEEIGKRCEAEIILAENCLGLSDLLGKTAFGREVKEVIVCVGTSDLDIDTSDAAG